jgi:hypothetical protein
VLGRCLRILDVQAAGLGGRGEVLGHRVDRALRPEIPELPAHVGLRGLRDDHATHGDRLGRGDRIDDALSQPRQQCARLLVGV